MNRKKHYHPFKSVHLYRLRYSAVFFWGILIILTGCRRNQMKGIALVWGLCGCYRIFTAAGPRDQELFKRVMHE